MTQPQRVLVLGGAGFVGRHAVEALLARGTSVVVGSRFPALATTRLPEHSQLSIRQVRLERLLHAHDWEPLLKDVDVVINCVGILRERFAETYERIAHLSPAALAKACAKRALRLIHVSALGLDNGCSSRFLGSKRRGEAALQCSTADWILVRPSLLDGRGGFGARWLHWVASWPIYFVPANALGKIAALDARDLGAALATLAMQVHAPNLSAEQRVYELGGSQSMSMAELLTALRPPHKSPPRLIRVPALLARLVAHVCDLLHVTPYSYGHLQLLQHDNIPAVNRLSELLGRPPLPIGVDAARATLLARAAAP